MVPQFAEPLALYISLPAYGNHFIFAVSLIGTAPMMALLFFVSAGTIQCFGGRQLFHVKHSGKEPEGCMHVILQAIENR